MGCSKESRPVSSIDCLSWWKAYDIGRLKCWCAGGLRYLTCSVFTNGMDHLGLLGSEAALFGVTVLFCVGVHCVDYNYGDAEDWWHGATV